MATHVDEWFPRRASRLRNEPEEFVIILDVSNPAAFSRRGSLIVLEFTDVVAALKVARKIALTTGYGVKVR